MSKYVYWVHDESIDGGLDFARRYVFDIGEGSTVCGICTGCQAIFHEEPGNDSINEQIADASLDWWVEERWNEAFEEHVQFDTPDGCPDDSEYRLEIH